MDTTMLSDATTVWVVMDPPATHALAWLQLVLAWLGEVGAALVALPGEIWALLCQAAFAVAPALPWLAGIALLAALGWALALLMDYLTQMNLQLVTIRRDQHALVDTLRNARFAASARKPLPSPPPGHELALAVADELVRMRRRLGQLPPETKAVDHLSRALGRLEQQLQSLGYTVRDLSGQPYVEGMRVNITSFTGNAEAAPSSRRILRMVKPQVLLAGQVIEPGTAEVETERSPV